MDFLGVSIVWPGKGRGACGRPVAQCHDARAGLPKSANPVLYVMHIHIWGLPVAQCHDARAGLPKSANPVLYVMHIHIWGLPVAQCHDARAGLPKSANPVLYVMHIHVMLLFFLLPFLVRS
jgi:hypothetical protein